MLPNETERGASQPHTNSLDGNFRNDEEKLSPSELFERGFSIYRQVQENSNLTSDERKSLILSGIRLLENLSARLAELHVFARNEDFDELPTSEVRFMLVDALLASLYQTKPGKIEQRLAIVETASGHYEKFLRTCADYGMFDADKLREKEEIEAPDDKGRLNFDMAKAAKTRQAKIENFKKSKLLEAKIHELERLEAIGELDEQGVRELGIRRINWWIQKAQDDLECLREERHLLQSRRVDLPLESSIEPAQERQATPFVILSTRQGLKSRVFGAGYPSQPTMSIEQFYDSLNKRGVINQCHPIGGALQRNEGRAPPPDEDDHEEELNAEKLKMQRAMDDWKDVHRKGEGNRYNRS